MPGMEAVIVAGGLGSRLRPLTARRPKHVLPVAGEPLLAHQLARLADAGVEHVVLATSYRADELRWELGDGERFGLRLSYAYEQTALGTGGAVRNALAELRGGAGDPVLVLNGDQLSDHDLRAQVSHFAAAGADVSLHVVVVGDPRPYGCVPTDAGGRVTAFREKSADPVSRQVNAGSYVFRRSVLAPWSATATTVTGSTSARRRLSSVPPATWCAAWCGRRCCRTHRGSDWCTPPRGCIAEPGCWAGPPSGRTSWSVTAPSSTAAC